MDGKARIWTYVFVISLILGQSRMILLLLPLILYCYFCKYWRSRLGVRVTGKDPVHWLSIVQTIITDISTCKATFESAGCGPQPHSLVLMDHGISGLSTNSYKTICVLKITPAPRLGSLTLSPRVASCLGISRMWKGSQIVLPLRGKVLTFRNSLLQDS